MPTITANADPASTVAQSTIRREGALTIAGKDVPPPAPPAPPGLLLRADGRLSAAASLPAGGRWVTIAAGPLSPPPPPPPPPSSTASSVVQASASVTRVVANAAPQTFAMPANFTAGNSAVVTFSYYTPAASPIASVSVNGKAATLLYREMGPTTAFVEFWRVDALPGAGSNVDFTMATTASTQYVNAHCIETTPLGALDQGRTQSGSSTTPTFSTSTALAQAESLVLAAWRDDNGVVNTATTMLETPFTLGISQRQGVSDVGSASGYLVASSTAIPTATFNVTPTTAWHGAIVAVRFATAMLDLGEIKMDWYTDNWVPLTLNIAPSTATPKILVTLGGWWDGNQTSAPTALPISNNGTFTAIYNPTKPNSNYPVVSQIAYMVPANSNPHTITPPNLQAQIGDGYLLALEIDGVDVAAPVRDKGRTFMWHTLVQSPAVDPNSYQSVTVTTDGTAAQVGDVAVLIVTIDMASVPPNIAFVPPAGWQVLRNHSDCSKNLGVLTCRKVVTAAGAQSATVTWTDPNTFIVDAQMVVFKKAP